MAFHITASAGAALAAVEAAGRFPARRDTQPGYRTIRVRASPGSALFTGSDGETWTGFLLSGDNGAGIGGEGVAHVRPDGLRELLKALSPMDRVRLFPGERGGLRLEAVHSVAPLRADFEDPGSPPQAEEDCLPPAAARFGAPLASPFDFRLPAAALKRLLAGPLPAVSREATRYYLEGICLQADTARGDLVAVGTDGHRLQALRAPLPPGAGSLAETIVHRSVVKAVLALLERPGPDEGATVAVRAAGGGGGPVSFATAEWEVRTKAIDGTYPDWRRVAGPALDGLREMRGRDEAPGRLVVKDPAALAAALAPLADGNRWSGGSGALLEFGSAPQSEGGGTFFRGASRDEWRAEIRVGVDVARHKGRALDEEEGYNARYLRDFCVANPGGFTLHGRTTPSGPGVVELEDGDALFMPARRDPS